MTEDIRDIIPKLPKVSKPQTPKQTDRAKKASKDRLLEVHYSLDHEGRSKVKYAHTGMPHTDEVEMSNCPICRHIGRAFEKFTNGVRPRMLAMANALRRS